MRRSVMIFFAFAILSGGVPSRSFAQGPRDFDYRGYASLLKAYVNEKGLVDYRGLKADGERLEAFLEALGSLAPERYSEWSEQEKIALWINAYNAFVLKTIVDNYPIKPSFFKLAVFPRHSIWHISGVWDNVKRPVMGRPMSLNDIEHETLRKKFHEPRIHVALVCASIGCPPLRREPYAGKRLDAQLDDQFLRFLSDPKNFRIASGEQRVYLSSIFKWFGEDFVEPEGGRTAFNGHSKKASAVLKYVSGYISPAEQNYLASQTYSIQYTDYDWSLNEQRDASSD